MTEQRLDSELADQKVPISVVLSVSTSGKWKDGQSVV